MIKITKLPNGGELDEYANGMKHWYLNGYTHREDGPAVDHPPSVDWPNGIKQWWLNGKLLRNCTSQEQFERIMKLQAFW
jgi:hypothetical protein